MSFSPAFLREVASELARVERRLNKIDARIEQAKRPSTKAKLSEQRIETARYAAWLRRKFFR